MMCINEKATKSARENIFKYKGEKDFLLRVKRNKNDIKIMIKCPQEIEEAVKRRNPSYHTKQLFGGTSNNINEADVYKGTILSSDVDDINSSMFLTK